MLGYFGSIISATDVTDMFSQADLAYETNWQRVVKLDCLTRPGLREVEFFGLFAKCDMCALVMIHQVFSYHCCDLLEPEDGLELDDEE